ncbi:MAG: hypothetical protein AAGH68_08600 [Pseudomonadota bacterium]
MSVPWSRQHSAPQGSGSVSAWLAPWQAAARNADVQAILLEAVEAQASLSARLRHDARVAGGGQRLAFEEVGDAMWLAGDAGARDRLAFYAADRRAAADPGDQQALWAVRRLLGDADPSVLSVSELRGFLGLHRAQDDAALDEGLPVDLFPRAQGEELDTALSDWLQVAAALAGAHRLVRAAILFRAWRWLGLSGPEDVVMPMVIASRVGAGQGSFVPFAGAARRLRVLATPGTDADKMVAMLRAFAEGAREAGLLLERSVIWQDRVARVATTKAERAVVDAVARHPVIGSNAIAAASGMTPQAINNAARALRAKSIIGEATGNTRFRLWQANL